jgi:hypothetical protein
MSKNKPTRPPTKAQLASKAKTAARVSKRAKLAEWSKAVRLRAGGACEICGATEHVQAHHILPKLFYPLYRLAWDNGIALCPRHHKYGPNSPHEGAVGFIAIFARMFPQRFALAMERVDQNSQAHAAGYVRAGATMQAGHTERGLP